MSSRFEIAENLILETDRLILRPVFYSDSESIVREGNDFHVANMIGIDFPHPYIVQDADSYKIFTKKAWEEGIEFSFSIFLKSNNTLIGGIGVATDSHHNVVRNLGYWLGKDHRGQGYMREAVRVMCEFSFDQLQVRKIRAGVFAPNLASQKTLERCGFVREGIFRQDYVMRDGNIVDDIKYGLLAEEFKK